MQNLHPKLSLVTICYNKVRELPMVLAALKAQSHPMEEIEIIIVDDGSDDGTGELFQSSWAPLWIRYHRLDHCGERARLRNIGAELANGEFLLFMDSDMVPVAEFISSHLAALRAAPDCVSLGVRKCLIDYDKAQLTESVVEKAFTIIEQFPALNDERTWLFESWKREGKDPDCTWTLLYSHNFALKRESYRSVGGFDPDFSRNWGAEDVELGYRLHVHGLGFALTEGALCYHLYHPSATQSKIQQLRKNLELFFVKHPSWEVELFCEEYKIGGAAYGTIRKAILAGKHLCEKAVTLHPYWKGEKNARIAAFGIPSTHFEPGEIETFFLPGSHYGQEGSLNRIGIRAPFKDGHFDHCLVSARYRDVDEGLYELITQEASRIGRRVWCVDDRVRGTDGIRDAFQVSSRPRILFTIRNAMGRSFPFQEHFYLSLALNLKRLGLGVGILRAYDPFKEIPVHGSFLEFADVAVRSEVESMFAKDWSLLDDRTPCIMDGEVAKVTQRSVGNRIWWDEIQYLHEETKIAASTLPHFSKVLARRSSDLSKLKPACDAGMLHVGVERDRLETLLNDRRPAGGGPFRFLWISNFVDKTSGLMETFAAFQKAFPQDPDVRLLVVHSDNIFPAHRNHYLNATFQEMALEGAMMLTSKMEHYRMQAIHAFPDPRIEFRNGKIEVEQAERLLAECDCLLSTNGLMSISPIVMNCVALGRKPILCAVEAYEGYFGPECAIQAACGRKNAGFLEPLPERIWPGERADLRYMEYLAPEIQGLAMVMKSARENPRSLEIAEADRDGFASRFDWKALAEAFADTHL